MRRYILTFRILFARLSPRLLTKRILFSTEGEPNEKLRTELFACHSGCARKHELAPERSGGCVTEHDGGVFHHIRNWDVANSLAFAQRGTLRAFEESP